MIRSIPISSIRFAKISGMEDIDTIITDAKIPHAVAKRIEEMGIDLIIAG